MTHFMELVNIHRESKNKRVKETIEPRPSADSEVPVIGIASANKGPYAKRRNRNAKD
jgi:hypothetical protein